MLPKTVSVLTALALALPCINACPNVTSFPNDKGWTKGAHITIYYTGGATSQQAHDVITAFGNWNSALGSNLTFSSPIGVSSMPPNPSVPYLELTIGSVVAAHCSPNNTACTSSIPNPSTANVDHSIITINPGFGTGTSLPLWAHELGHSYGLAECDGCGSTQTIMDGSDITPSSPTSPLPCDKAAIATETNGQYGGSASGGSGGGTTTCNGPSPISCPPGGSPECDAYGWYCSDSAGCNSPQPEPCCEECYESCEGGQWVCVGSPVILDVFGNGFHLTDIQGGVKFKVLPTEEAYQMSWPEAASRNGWLALDRNGDGRITNFTELFGNATPQPKSDDPNGYRALAVFDEPTNGGNGNGVIDPGDAIFDHLLVWIDDNHNGISEPNELHTLREAGIFRIDLTYWLSERVDENGNLFRYKAKVWDEAGAAHDMCYDVYVRIAANQ